MGKGLSRALVAALVVALGRLYDHQGQLLRGLVAAPCVGQGSRRAVGRRDEGAAGAQPQG